MLIMKTGNNEIRLEWNYQIKKKIERAEKKKTYKYLGILEADTIKQIEMEEKIKKSISGERENYSRQNYFAETLSKG